MAEKLNDKNLDKVVGGARFTELDGDDGQPKKKVYHYTCLECGHTWDSEDSNITECPSCHKNMISMNESSAKV